MEVALGTASHLRLVPRDSKEPFSSYNGLNLIERRVVDDQRLNTSISPTGKIPTWLDAGTQDKPTSLEFM